MKKILLGAGISMLCMAVWMMGGCTNDPSDTAQNGALLAGLNTMTEEEAAFSIVTALPTAQETGQSSSGGSSSVSSTKEMLAEINKKASSTFLKSELSVPLIRKSVVIAHETCEEGTCFTLSGTSNCSNGGSMTFNDLKMSMTMVTDENNENKSTMTGDMDGSITYAQCGGKSQNWLSYPEYVYAVIDGTIAQNGQFDDVVILLGGDIFSGNYTLSSTRKDTTTVTSESVSVNGRSFSQVQLNCNNDLMMTAQISNQTYVSDGHIFTMSGDYIETITGRVLIEGTLGTGNEINVERIFNTETFRYHSTCTMDEDNFSVTCSVRKM